MRERVFKILFSIFSKAITQILISSQKMIGLFLSLILFSQLFSHKNSFTIQERMKIKLSSNLLKRDHFFFLPFFFFSNNSFSFSFFFQQFNQESPTDIKQRMITLSNFCVLNTDSIPQLIIKKLRQKTQPTNQILKRPMD